MATLLPGAVWRPISVNYGGFRRSTRGVVFHVSASATAKSLYGWFSNPSAQASSHLHIDVDGVIEQYVDLDRIAWTHRAANATMIGIETQGGANGGWTDAQVKSLVYAATWLAQRYGFPLGDMGNSKLSSRGVGLHRYGCSPWRVAGGEVWGPNGKVCPGNDRVAQFKGGMLGGAATPPPAPGGGSGSANNPYNPWGWSGDYVREIQILLNKLGYGLATDGVLGAATSAAIKDFQGKNSLTADGSPGANTKAKLVALTTAKPVDNPKPSIPQLDVDGEWGAATTRRLQQHFGTPVDGVISGQVKGNWNKNVHSAAWGRGGSSVIAAIQRMLGVSADGYLGPNTIKAIQGRMGTARDGVVSPKSSMVMEMQRRLNRGTF